MSDDKNARVRRFLLELYPDNEAHIKAIEKLCNGSVKGVKQWVGIKHDKDTYEETTDSHNEGDIKKTHYHFILNLDNSCTRSALAKRLGLSADNERFIEPIEKFKGALMYLIHYNTEKYQYSVNELIGDADLIALITEKSQVNNQALQFNSMCKFIENCEGTLCFTTFGQICYKNGWYGVLKRNNNFFINALKEHNKGYN